MRHSARTNYFVPHGALVAEKGRDRGLGGGGSMDKRHHYRVGSHSGTWDDLPTNPDLITGLKLSVT